MSCRTYAEDMPSYKMKEEIKCLGGQVKPETRIAC